MNLLRATDKDGNVSVECLIETGSALAARRVPTHLAKQIPTDATVEVQTRRGWERRYLVELNGRWYTRTHPRVIEVL